MNHASRWIAACSAMLVGSLSTARANRVQSDAPPPAPAAPAANGATAPAPAPAQAEVPRLEAWPKPTNKDAIQKDIERVCRAGVPAMATAGRDALVAAGTPAVPFVLERFGKEKDADAAGRLREVLIAITAPEQSRLLAKEFDSKLAPVRAFVLWRVAEFQDSGVRAAFETTWGRIEKQGEKIDREERYAAALCGASSGSMKGFEFLFETAVASWDQRGPEIRRAIEPLRSREASLVLADKIKQNDRKTTVAALRMLGGCGDKESVAVIWPLLESQDNGIKIAAINAMRGVVDHEPPLEQMSAFEAIEHAKKWKTRF